eukprot:jgi/Chlat1/5269/Chrsp33S05099
MACTAEPCFLLLLLLAALATVAASAEPPHAPCEPVPEGSKPTIQCQRNPSCIRHNHFFPFHVYDWCKDWKQDSDWPTWDPYLTRTPSMRTMGDIAEIMGNKVLLILGDSIDWLMYTAAICGLSRANHLSKDSARREQYFLQGSEVAKKVPGSWVTSYTTIPHDGVVLFSRLDKLNAEVIQGFMEFVDILIVNFGLHYKPEEFDSFVEDTAMLGKMLHEYSSQPGKIGLMRELGAQHFYGTGAFNRTDPRHFGALGVCQCFPMDDAVAHTNLVQKQNRVIHEVAFYLNNFHMLPFYEVTSPRYDMHEEKYCLWNKGEGQECCDCSHYCYVPVFWDAVFTDLYNIIEQHFNKQEGTALT